MTEWICAGRTCVRALPGVSLAAQNAFAVASAVLPGRVHVNCWVRYHVSLVDTPEAAGDVHLIPLTDAIVSDLRNHADRDANQLKSGLHFWEQGLRRAYIWMADGAPLCVQWLLTAADRRLLKTLGGWAGMYPPLDDGCGQVENLFAFSGVRRKGVATNFEHALFRLARESGLNELVTHIHEANGPARGWADRTGWTPFGRISRYEMELPLVRERGVFVHDAFGIGPPPILAVNPLPITAHA